MCEVLNADGTPHPSNGRATIEDDDNDFWFGFEQEYFLWDTIRPINRLVFLTVVFLVRRVLIIAQLVQLMLLAVILWKNILTPVLMQV